MGESYMVDSLVIGYSWQSVCIPLKDDPARDIRICNQFLITRALHFAQPR